MDIKLNLNEAQRQQIRDLSEELGRTKEEIALMAQMIGLGILEAKKQEKE